MTDLYKGPFGTAFGNVGTVDATAKAALNVTLNSIRVLFNGSTAAVPDFQKIPPATAAKIDLELSTLIAAITAHS